MIIPASYVNWSKLRTTAAAVRKTDELEQVGYVNKRENTENHFTNAFVIFFSEGVTYSSSSRGSRLSSAASGIDGVIKSQPTSAASASKATNFYQTPIGKGID